MYKIIVADDEEDVRRGIIERICWEEYGFVISGEAENGKEALELCEKEMPDVLITDISMPYINGLEVLETLNARYPKPIVIFLTAYDEFEYAQRAVRLNAAEYILKPITSEELIGMLKKLKASMDEEAIKREDINFLRREFENNLPVLREKFLSLLLNGRMKAGNIGQKAKAYGLETLCGKACLVGVVMADGETESCDESGFDKTEHRELVQFAIYNIANEIMEAHQRGITFLYGDNVLLICLGEDEGSLIEDSLKTFNEIGQSIKKYLRFTVTTGAGHMCSNVEDIQYSYDSAVTACNYKMLLGGDKVIYILDMEPASLKNAAPRGDTIQKLISSIRSAVWTETNALIDDIFAGAVRCLSTANEYIPYIFEVVTAILKTAKDLGVDPGLTGPDAGRFIGILNRANLAELKAWVKQTCETVLNEAASSRQDANKMMVKEAIDYIHKHYADSGISMETVCRHIHISQSYFCAIFKKETDDTFNNYLHHIRMQAAKELLRTKDMKLREIAERTGYADPNYFSFAFKKTFGISPREYRSL